MEGAEVAEEKGVGREVSRLIRLWKCVEKSNDHGWITQPL
jgi:hypothetical protein